MKRTRTGSKLGLAAAAALLVSGFPLAGADKQKKAPAPSAVVSGTVFRDNGMTLPGAQVTLTAAGESKEARKFKRLELVTNSRGEFAFRLPAQPGQYKLTVKAAGYEPQEKRISLAGEDSIDVFIRLEAASKK